MIFNVDIERLIEEDINLIYDENEQIEAHKRINDVLSIIFGGIDFECNKIYGSYTVKIFDNDLTIKYRLTKSGDFDKENLCIKIRGNVIYINGSILNGKLDDNIIERVLYCLGIFYEKTNWAKTYDKEIFDIETGQRLTGYRNDSLGGLYYAYKYKTNGVIDDLYDIIKYIDLIDYIDFKDIDNIYKVIKDSDLYHKLCFIKQRIEIDNEEEITKEVYHYIVNLLHFVIMHIYEKKMPFSDCFDIKKIFLYDR